jgi:hypothetical protein
MSGLLANARVAAGVAVLVLAAGGTALAVTSSSPGHVVSMPVAGRSTAALKVAAGTPVLDVSVAKLGGILLRVSTPNASSMRPVLSGSSLVTLSLAGARGHGQPGPVDVVLNSAVVWSIDFASGTQRTDADLRGGKIHEIAVTAGSDILDVSLPKPVGSLSFLLAGGVSQFQLSLPSGVPVRVTVGGGASLVSLGGQSRTGLAGGTVLTTPGWTSAASRFDIDATSGFDSLTVSRW